MTKSSELVEKTETNKDTFSIFTNLTISGLAGMGSAAIVHPLEVLKYRMQLSGEKGTTADHKNSYRAVMNIAKNEKFQGFYKGLSANLARQAVFTSTRIGLYTSFTDLLNERGYKGFKFNAFTSIISGAIAAIIATPFDVAMVRMTADGRLPLEQRRNYKNVIDALWTIRIKEGVRGLWIGTVPTINRAMIGNFSQMTSYDATKSYIVTRYGLKDGMKLYFFSSVVAGGVYAVCTSPMDVLKTRMQQQKIIESKPEYSSMMDAAVNLVKKESPKAFWKGLPFYYLRVAPATVLMFTFKEKLEALYRKTMMGGGDQAKTI